MLGKHESLHQVNWDNLLAALGKDGLIKLFDESTLVSLVNWTMLPKMTDIWRRLLAEVFPHLTPRRPNLVHRSCRSRETDKHRL